MSETVAPAACPNCGRALDGPYCAQCGQRAAPLNPRLRDVLGEVAQEVFPFDNALLRTTRLLVARPGFLSLEHFAGRRKRYVAPLRLYLIFSILYFAVAAFAPDAGVFRVTRDPDDTPEEAAVLDDLQRAGNEALTVWIPRAMFVLMPAFAGLVGLTVRRAGRNYPQHVYFALHVHAAWFLAGAIAAAARIHTIPVLTTTVGVLSAVYAAAHLTIAIRKVYGKTLWGATWRTAVVGLLYMLTIGIVITLIVLPLALPLIRASS